MLELTFTLTEAKIINGIISGDSKAESALYNQYFKLALDTALKITRNSGEAEEIANEALLDLIESIKIGKIKDKSKLKSYLLSITSNKAKNLLREKAAFKRGGEFQHIAIDASEDHLIKPVPQDESDTTEDEHQTSKDEAAQSLIDSIPDERVRLVARLKWEGYTYREIADMLDLPVQGTMNIYHFKADRALAKVYAKLKQQQLEENTNARLDDLETVLNQWKKNYRYLTHGFQDSLRLINDVLLSRIPKATRSDVLYFKSEVLVFLLEILVNKGQTRGQYGACGTAPAIFAFCIEANDLERQIRTKKAESVGWRIHENYEQALRCLDDAEVLATQLPNKKLRDRINSSIKGNRGRILTLTGYPESAGKLIHSAANYYADAGDSERIAVKKAELAHNAIKLADYDKALALLDEVSDVIPAQFINGQVKYHKILAELHLVTQQFDNAYTEFHNAWTLSAEAGLLNQFADLLKLLSEYNCNPSEPLSTEELQHGRAIIEKLQYHH